MWAKTRYRSSIIWSVLHDNVVKQHCWPLVTQNVVCPVQILMSQNIQWLNSRSVNFIVIPLWLDVIRTELELRQRVNVVPLIVRNRHLQGFVQLTGKQTSPKTTNTDTKWKEKAGSEPVSSWPRFHGAETLSKWVFWENAASSRGESAVMALCIMWASRRTAKHERGEDGAARPVHEFRAAAFPWTQRPCHLFLSHQQTYFTVTNRRKGMENCFQGGYQHRAVTW